MTIKIYLASKSPRRQQLLQQIGVEFESIDVAINEHWDGKENPHAYVERVALEKAQKGKTKLKTADTFVVLGADTSVVLDDIILGKAENETQARTMLQQLSGRKHYVHTAVAAVTDTMTQIMLNTSAVCFRTLSKSEIFDYCETGEPIGKAGGYAIQGKAAIFIERIEGSYSGIMGLPLFETWQLLNKKINI